MDMISVTLPALLFLTYGNTTKYRQRWQLAVVVSEMSSNSRLPNLRDWSYHFDNECNSFECIRVPRHLKVNDTRRGQEVELRYEIVPIAVPSGISSCELGLLPAIESGSPPVRRFRCRHKRMWQPYPRVLYTPNCRPSICGVSVVGIATMGRQLVCLFVRYNTTRGWQVCETKNERHPACVKGRTSVEAKRSRHSSIVSYQAQPTLMEYRKKGVTPFETSRTTSRSLARAPDFGSIQDD